MQDCQLPFTSARDSCALGVGPFAVQSSASACASFFVDLRISHARPALVAPAFLSDLKSCAFFIDVLAQWVQVPMINHLPPPWNRILKSLLTVIPSPQIPVCNHLVLWTRGATSLPDLRIFFGKSRHRWSLVIGPVWPLSA